MDVNRSSFDDLVAAYALDACEPDEATAIEAFAERDPLAASEIERLRNAAAWLGAAGALTPPPDLRARLMTEAGARPPAAAPAMAYEIETQRIDDLLDDLASQQLEVRTHNGLTVHELISHLEVVDAAFRDEMISEVRGFIGAGEVEEITRTAFAARGEESFETMRERWRATRRSFVESALAVPRGTTVAGYQSENVPVIRAFEAWTHHADIRRALRLPAADPGPAVMRTLASLAAHSIPFALAVSGRSVPGQSARVVLTGRGGGTFLTPLHPGEIPSDDVVVEVHAPALEWCLRFGDRIAADAVPMEIVGDRELAAAMVETAPAFAGL